MRDTTRSYRTLPNRSLINMALIGAGHIELMYLPTAKVLEELAIRYETLLPAVQVLHEAQKLLRGAMLFEPLEWKERAKDVDHAIATLLVATEIAVETDEEASDD